MELSLDLATRAVARRIVRRRRDPREDLEWAPGYPMEGDQRACQAYLRQLPVLGGGSRSNPFGYYQIVVESMVVGGIGFHGPPREGLVEVGYGVVPAFRGRGIATASLRQLLAVARQHDSVRRVRGRTTPDNEPSQKVLLSAGLRFCGRDPEFLHYEAAIEEVTA